MRTLSTSVLLAGLGLTVFSANAWSASLDRAFPADPSSADDIVIGVAWQCLVGAMQAPEIQVTGANSYTLTYVYSGNMEACPSLIPPVTAYPTNIGKLPVGYHDVHFVGKLGDEVIYEADISFRVNEIAGRSVSGAWYAPQQSGRGAFILRMPLGAGQTLDENLFSVYWATHDAHGNPTWALTSGMMTNNVVSGTAVNTTGTPLAPGTAELEQQPWGTLSFEYLGCDQGRLTWDAADPAITDGSVNLVKLANPDGQEACTMAHAIQAVWIE